MTKSEKIKQNMKLDERAESYEVLLNDIATLYEEKVGMGIRQRNEQLVVSYWEIGDRIVSGEKSAGITARYGKKLIPQLSADLTERFGSGFGETNIFEIRRFRLEYSRKDLHPLLTWAHYRALMSVRDATRREELEARAIAERLPFKKLKALARLTNGMSIAENRKDLLTPRKQFVQSRVTPENPVTLLTYGCDMYGRYLADVFYSGPHSAERLTVESGRFLNAEILEKGIAGFWDAMRWK